MRQHNLDVQAAINMIGKMCKAATERFVNDRKQLPSWGPEIDRQVSLYCDGLQDWIVGTLNWSFETERYFGKGGQEMKEKRVVTLLPVRKVELVCPLAPFVQVLFANRMFSSATTSKYKFDTAD